MRRPHGGVMVQFPDERRVLLDTTEDEEDLDAPGGPHDLQNNTPFDF